MCFEFENVKISALESIGKLSQNYEKVRQRQLSNHKKLSTKYKDKLDSLTNRNHGIYYVAYDYFLKVVKVGSVIEVFWSSQPGIFTDDLSSYSS